MLTAHARDFYFALQDLLRAVGGAPDWTSDRSADDPATVFRRLLERKHLVGGIATLDMLKSLDLVGWPANISTVGEDWHVAVRALATDWNDLSESERFAVMQQVGSVLRTVLVNDIESRLR